jgi:hypothetical protein
MAQVPVAKSSVINEYKVEVCHRIEYTTESCNPCMNKNAASNETSEDQYFDRSVATLFDPGIRHGDSRVISFQFIILHNLFRPSIFSVSVVICT